MLPYSLIGVWAHIAYCHRIQLLHYRFPQQLLQRVLMEPGSTAKAVLLAPGESKEVVWTFTEKAAIEFACNVSGHYQAGMYGEVNFN